MGSKLSATSPNKTQEITMLIADQGTLDATDNRLSGKKITIGIVQARFNAGVTDALAAACLAELQQLGVPEKHITLVQVPGALEVPVALLAMAEKLKFDALIALGCIIRGETYHFELVANESGAGVSRVALDYQLPIANAILTTENMEQAIARQTDKGRDAARVAVEMANLLESI
jgi:6,7-dimethyl-8-ribityllumazine synthase